MGSAKFLEHLLCQELVKRWLSWLNTACHAGGRELFDSGRTNTQGL